MRWPLVIFDFSPDPSEFPYLREKYYLLFDQCIESMKRGREGKKERKGGEGEWKFGKGEDRLEDPKER
jgi:hypothetical protein